MAESVRARLQPTQVLAGLVGLAFLALGVIGFVHTGFNDFAGQGHTMLWGVFAINPLHNVLHLLFGVVGVLLALTSATSRLYGWVLFAAYGVLLVWGLMLVGLTSTNPVSELGNPLNLNIADNWLHLGLAVLGLVIAIVPLRRKVVETEPAPVAIQEPVTDPVPVQQPQPVATTTDEPATVQEERKPRGLHRLGRLRSKGTTAH
ncbi:DUF4383 domain-containing protein [Kibdelosporangium phytohabitans]|uniref:DUF4383 domain-containing protein n=1 Tax=Kibdelosporangium phytohabitans TaxID=860235 RepID=A0A0N9IDU0_9PSEU|nr:DUF4383 domain-containing protein [Kibdelosporangium phytohabitans]ALG12934.1 hypothetical protein AOZ06_44195 [Kibdelosporangium phytohabitans]MBE1464643.1 hypothetical protein [Kibdelosporangium phytohabitans]